MKNPLKAFARPYTVTRPAGDWTSDGLWKRLTGSDVTLHIMASIQPLNGREIMLLPDGERDRETVKVYTDTALVIADQEAQQKGDQIAYNGGVYEVMVKSNWTETRLAHFKYLARKQPADL